MKIIKKTINRKYMLYVNEKIGVGFSTKLKRQLGIRDKEYWK
jgi:hypothetical protein